jgi:hypothetical protein
VTHHYRRQFVLTLLPFDTLLAPEEMATAGVRNETTGRSENQAQRIDQINALIEKYSFLARDKNPSLPSSTSVAPTDKVVLLTGTTGNLGSDILATLLHDSTVRKVYALNRLSPKALTKDRVKEQFDEKGLASNLLDSQKVTFIDGKLTDSKLGLTKAQYDEVGLSGFSLFSTIYLVCATSFAEK